MAILFRHLEMRDLHKTYAQLLLSALEDNRKRSGHYVSDVAAQPLFKQTCRVLHCLTSLNLPRHHVQLMSAWLDECECPAGGYGPRPRSMPSLPHTAIALQTMLVMGRNVRQPMVVHKAWLKQELHSLRHQCRDMPAGEWLEGMRLAIDGLSACGDSESSENSLRRDLSQHSFQIWLTTRRNTRDTLNLARILAWCAHANGDEIEWLRQRWLPAAEARWVMLQPSAYVHELADAIEILHGLMPKTYRERASVIRITDNLTKAFERRIQKVKPD